MSKEQAEKQKERFKFLEDKHLIIENLKYKVLKVDVKETDGKWETYLLVNEIDEIGNSKYNHTATRTIDTLFLQEMSVILAEIEQVNFSEYGCVRLKELIGQLLTGLPHIAENLGIIEHIKTQCNPTNLFIMEDGHKEFDKIKNYVLEKLVKYR